MDGCKIAENLYQYTAIDDCTRYKIIGLYSRKTAKNTVKFLYEVRLRMPLSYAETDFLQQYEGIDVWTRVANNTKLRFIGQ